MVAVLQQALETGESPTLALLCSDGVLLLVSDVEKLAQVVIEGDETLVD